MTLLHSLNAGAGYPARTSLRVVAVVSAATLALAACGSDDDDDDDDDQAAADDAGSVTLEYWGWVPNVEDAVDDWNEANPDIQVNFTRMTGDDGDKIPSAVDAGTGPDIAQMSQHQLPDFVINERVVDISDYVAGAEDLFTESSWSAVVFADAVYGVPQDSGPAAMMYRTDIFEEHDIDVPATWTEYIEAGRELQQADPDVYIGQFSPNEMGLWYQDMVQAGGSWYGIEDDAWTLSINDEASQRVAEKWQTLVDDGLVKTTQMWTPEYWADINNGNIATITYAAWFPALLKENAADLAGNWAVAPGPTFEGSDAAGDTGGAVTSVMAGAEHPEEAAEFITWLNSSEEGVNHLVTGGGVFPAAKIGLENEDLVQPDDYFGGQEILEVYKEAALKVPGGNQEGPGYQLVQNDILDGFADVANGDATFSSVLDDAQEGAVERMRDQGLDVK
ncbi:ABC transporter substrate-binding protein [Phytoactinopolyspora endophytica]|uniref:ABC transporter substrate-binding protein n=1 Tax=Phytoactinopolyspora endophytica TaxID=1642495 RepID=UPI0013EAF6D7|nr:sugar ABC transporter substrate-binding protein [Phytoactinopolyspora endophytica]